MNATIPNELNGALPRRVSLTSAGRTNLVFFYFLIVLALAGVVWIGVYAALQVHDRAALRSGGVETTAEIAQTWIAGRPSKLKVRYNFTVNGTAFEGVSWVPDALWQSVRDASVLPIRYLPANPKVNHPAAWEDSIAPTLLWFLPLIVPAAFGILGLTELNARRRLVTEGLAAEAVITKSSRSKNGFTVSYEFRTESGKTTAGSKVFASQPEIGAKICVLYLKWQPERNMQYPTDSCRVMQ